MEESLITQTRKDNQEMMIKIANDQQSLEDIKMLTSSKVTDQLKVFLVSQARNELNRVVKLTQFLDKLESSFMNKVDESIANDELTLKQYGDIIGVITSLLSRSNDIISKVLNDDSLMTILNTTIYTADSGTATSSNQVTSIISELKDPQSRERVRVVLSQIIRRADDYIEDTQATEVSENGGNSDGSSNQQNS